MATDSAILTAARQHQQAQDAVQAAYKASELANADATAKARLLEEAKKRANEVQTRLLMLASQKPAEPAPLPHPPEKHMIVAQPIYASEPPKNMADGMAATSDADAPQKPRKGDRRVHTS